MSDTKPTGFLTLMGEFSAFGLKALGAACVPPFEWMYFFNQVEQISLICLTLICAAGLSPGLVAALHTRTTMVNFGAEAWIPTLQSASFFYEIGPFVTGLLIANSGRVVVESETWPSWEKKTQRPYPSSSGRPSGSGACIVIIAGMK